MTNPYVQPDVDLSFINLSNGIQSVHAYYPEVCQLAGSGNIRGRAIAEKVHRYQYVLIFTLNIRSMYTYLLSPLMKGNKVA